MESDKLFSWGEHKFPSRDAYLVRKTNAHIIVFCNEDVAKAKAHVQ